MMSADNVVITTVNNTRRVFNRPNASYQIAVAVKDIKQMDAAQERPQACSVLYAD